ncbi:hypothetical protein CCUS01_11506 [Colletotrichum cuscutae]|uniref:Uncharacterized protein n=1 Tax=Colletotrichum cuscutae TaxID=1209917 RepID=A0AAI9XHL5_9PEZI|nr:hypothetical protein CCUS01_11506 [Colletotrichum cuscutae]
MEEIREPGGMLARRGLPGGSTMSKLNKQGNAWDDDNGNGGRWGNLLLELPYLVPCAFLTYSILQIADDALDSAGQGCDTEAGPTWQLSIGYKGTSEMQMCLVISQRPKAKLQIRPWVELEATERGNIDALDYLQNPESGITMELCNLLLLITPYIRMFSDTRDCIFFNVLQRGIDTHLLLRPHLCIHDELTLCVYIDTCEIGILPVHLYPFALIVILHTPYTIIGIKLDKLTWADRHGNAGSSGAAGSVAAGRPSSNRRRQRIMEERGKNLGKKDTPADYGNEEHLAVGSATAEKKTKTKKKKNMCLASSKTTKSTADGPRGRNSTAFDIWQPEPEPLPAGDLFDVLPRRMPLTSGLCSLAPTVYATTTVHGGKNISKLPFHASILQVVRSCEGGTLPFLEFSGKVHSLAQSLPSV